MISLSFISFILFHPVMKDASFILRIIKCLMLGTFKGKHLSRIIITTRDFHLLRRVHKVFVHEVETMSPSESFQLFCQKVFGSRGPEEEFLEVSRIVCDYAKGLPLALSVLASNFRGRTSVQEWQDALEMLKKDTHKAIFEVLEIS